VGVEIRKTPGLPPWGVIEHIPGKFDIVLYSQYFDLFPILIWTIAVRTTYYTV